MKKIVTILMCFILLTGCALNEQPEGNPEKEVVEQPQQLTDSCYRYYYDTLNETQKDIYTKLYQGYIAQETTIKVDTSDTDLISNIHNYILMDYPEIFYISKLSIASNNQVYVEYSFDASQIKDYQNQLETISQSIIEQLNQQPDSYLRLQALYDYVILNNTYNAQAIYNQEIISSLINQDTVCAGYTKMFQYLANEMGYQVTQIQGNTNDETNQSHAWNMIFYENDYYYIDTTNGDGQIVDYSYFMISSNDAKVLYTANVPIKETTNLNNTYFVRNGYLLDGYSIRNIRNAKKNNYLIIKCTDEIYDQTKQNLFTNNDIFEVLNYQTTKVSHYENDKLKTITVMW